MLVPPVVSPPAGKVSFWRRIPWGGIALGLFLIAYTFYLWTHFAPATSEPDDNGYFAQGSLLAQTGRTWFKPDSDAQYIGMHWLVTPDKQTFVSRYPPGMAVMIAVIYDTLGYKAAVFLNPALAVLALGGLYLLARRIVAPGWALTAVALLAVNPTFFHHALGCDAHMPVLCAVVWGLYFLQRWSTQQRLWQVFVAGLILGCIPSIRYADAIMGVAVGLFVVAHIIRWPRTWWLYLIGGIPAFFTVVALAIVCGIILWFTPDPLPTAGLTYVLYKICIVALWTFVPLTVLALLGLLVWSLIQSPKSCLPCIAGAIGAAIPIIPMLIYNQRLMGAFWKTAYSLTNEQTGFTWEYFKEHALDYVHQIHANGLGLVFAIGIVGITTMICTRTLRRLGIMTALMTIPMLLVYMAYYWAPQMNSQMTMRFILPTFPIYILAGIWALSELTTRIPVAARLAVPAALIGIQLLMGAPEIMTEADQLHYQREVLTRATDALQRVAPPGSVVVADNQLYQHLDFVRLWKLADESVYRAGGGGFGGGGGGGRGFGFGGGGVASDNPSPQQAEKRTLHVDHYTGTTANRQNIFFNDIETWAAGQKIYIIGTQTSIDNALGGTGTVETVAKVALPEPPGQSIASRSGRNRGGMMGGPPGGPGGPGGGGFGRPAGGGGGGFMGRGNYGSELLIVAWTPDPPKKQFKASAQ